MYNPIAVAKADQMICSMIIVQGARVYIEMGTIEFFIHDTMIFLVNQRINAQTQ
jgi:hypothetical protein